MSKKVIEEKKEHPTMDELYEQLKAMEASAREDREFRALYNLDINGKRKPRIKVNITAVESEYEGQLSLGSL